MEATFLALIVTTILLSSNFSTSNPLSVNYYDKTCPGAEAAVTKAVHGAFIKDKTVAATLLRMHFHDCFVRVKYNFPSLFFFLKLLYCCMCFNNNWINLCLFLFNFKGCDASVLLNSTKNNEAEKDGAPNVSLHAFYVIDNAKKQVEKMCPGVVSCADILAIGARDSVSLVSRL